MGAIQQTLLKDDCYVPGVCNEDDGDLARKATVVASSESAGCTASNVINGLARRTATGSNMWESAEGAELPAWIDLQFPHAVDLREIRLTFDTELSRMLTLTHYEEVRDQVIRAPQPETVRDYDVLVRRADAWEVVERVRGNYQRHRVHAVETGPIEGVRIQISGTNGIPVARIFEIRCYP